MRPLTLLLIVALLLTGTAWAQQAGSISASHPNLPPGGTTAGASQIAITPDEWQELRAARTAALQANPDLVAENKKLLERMRTLEDKLDVVMVKADPTIASILAKFEANRPHPGITTSTPPLTTPPPAK